MVKHAGSGLVSKGSDTLKLMKNLFWMFTLVLIAVGYGNMPLAMQLKPGFPANTVIGKILFKRECKSKVAWICFPFSLAYVRVFVA